MTKQTSIVFFFLFHSSHISLYVDRFRQIEVLHQVTTAFNSFVGGVNAGAQKLVESHLSEEARVRRKRVGMLFQNASKKSLSQLADSGNQQPLSPSLAGHFSSPEFPGELPLDKRIPMKRVSLSPLVEEQTLVSEEAESPETTTLPQVKSSSPRGGKELKNVTSTIASAKVGTGMPAESFELEEVMLLNCIKFVLNCIHFFLLLYDFSLLFLGFHENMLLNGYRTINSHT